MQRFVEEAGGMRDEQGQMEDEGSRPKTVAVSVGTAGLARGKGVRLTAIHSKLGPRATGEQDKRRVAGGA